MIKFADIRNKARELGISPGRLSKKEMIQKIQVKEGNEPCFDMGIKNCDKHTCCWREFCLK